jgi:hypothetical protein
MTKLRGRIRRRRQDFFHNAAKLRLFTGAQIDTDGCDNLSLVDRNIGHGKALDQDSVARDKPSCPGFIVVCPGGYGFSPVENLRQLIAVRNRRQKLRHADGIIQQRGCQVNVQAPQARVNAVLLIFWSLPRFRRRR